MKYRSRTDIFVSILQVAMEKGIRITKVMYTCFLSYNQIKYFLKLLIDHCLLEYNETQRIYRTTKKGLKYLELYRQMEKLVKTD